jgi:uncharacterized surface protein with fasciclin (FAS1) repeats
VLSTLLLACNTNQPKETPKSEPKADSTGFDPRKAGQRALDKRNAPYSTESAFRYVDTAPETKLWAGMLRRSKFAKDVEAGTFTLLVPTNEVLKAYNPERMKLIRADENIEMLNAFVANHILKTPITVEKMGELTEVETITGKKLKVQGGAQNIGGGIYMLNQIFTPQGSVVLMSKLID